MAEVRFDALERRQLCELFIELGPDAPSLLGPWSTRDLAAHLVLRSTTTSRHPDLFFPGRGIGWPRGVQRSWPSATSRHSSIASGRGRRRASSASVGSGALPTSTSSSCITRTCAGRTARSHGAMRRTSMLPCGATSLVHRGFLPAVCGVWDSNSSGQAQTSTCEHGEASRRLDSSDRLANSCCISSDDATQPRSRQQASPPRLPPFARHHSACRRLQVTTPEHPRRRGRSLSAAEVLAETAGAEVRPGLVRVAGVWSRVSVDAARQQSLDALQLRQVQPCSNARFVPEGRHKP